MDDNQFFRRRKRIHALLDSFSVSLQEDLGILAAVVAERLSAANLSYDEVIRGLPGYVSQIGAAFEFLSERKK